MIGVKQALDKLNSNVNKLPISLVYLKEALGGVLAEDVIAPVTFPPFDQSAMDGYAVCGLDLHEFVLVGEVKAGDDASVFELKEGECVRIFTGAMVPATATAVVKQEDVQTESVDRIKIEKQIRDAENIRFEGEQIKNGQIVAQSGTPVNTGLVAYCAMLGIEKFKIYRKPRICLMTTGSELVSPGNQLKPGQIYDSNSVMLETALLELGFHADVISVKDELESTANAVENALMNYDLVLITGGISVGDYDFVYESLSRNGVKEIFYKVNQKPGKPLYMGTKKETVVFGLPGNPASVFTCFQIYVLSAIRAMIGLDSSGNGKIYANLKGSLKKMDGKTQFLKAVEKDGEVEVLKRQSSAMLGDFVDANCFVVFDETLEFLENEEVEIIRLPKQFLF